MGLAKIALDTVTDDSIHRISESRHAAHSVEARSGQPDRGAGGSERGADCADHFVDGADCGAGGAAQRPAQDPGQLEHAALEGPEGEPPRSDTETATQLPPVRTFQQRKPYEFFSLLHDRHLSPRHGSPPGLLIQAIMRCRPLPERQSNRRHSAPSTASM